MATQTIVQSVLTGSFLMAVGGFLKFVVDTWRSSRAARSPLSVATSTNAVAQTSIDILVRTNAEMDEENARIRKLWHAAEDGRERDRAAHEAREATLKAEVMSLEASVRALQDQIRSLESQLRSLGSAASSLQTNVTAFKEREFPNP